jgi:hypothetical protein
MMCTSSTAASTTLSVLPSVAVNRSRMSSLGGSRAIKFAVKGAHPLVGDTRCSSRVQLVPPLFDTSALKLSLDAESS